jgi:hypothetical protein
MATASRWSDEPRPQFSPAKIPEEAPPRRVKKPCARPGWAASVAAVTN